MITRLSGVLAILFSMALAIPAQGQLVPPPPPAKGTAAYNESVFQTQRKAAIASTPTPDALVVVAPKTTNTNTILVTNNLITVTNYQSSVSNKLVSNWTYTFAPPFNVYWSSNVNGPYSNALFVAQGHTNWMETFLFTTGQRFFYTKYAGNVTN